MNKKQNFRKKGMLFFLFLIIIVQIMPQKVKADGYWPQPPDIVTPCAVVMEVNTGTVLYEKNGYEQHYPASITKVMTTMLALEYCELDEIVVFSKEAVLQNVGDSSSIWRDIGEELTMEQCLYAVMLASANECAYAVAEHVGKKLGGDYQTFIDLMNSRAKELGCTNTHFNNPNGLPDPDHWTCTYDMALIAKEAFKNENFRIITGTGRYTIPPTNKHDEETYMLNHHKMLYQYKTPEFLYEYCVGGKTGYTDAARHTLVTYTQKDGLTLVIVVMYTSSTDQFTDTTQLSDFFFDNYRALNISENETRLADNTGDRAGVLRDGISFVELNQDAYIILPTAAEFTEAEFVIDHKPDPSTIATLDYSYGGKVVGSAEIVTTGAKIENTFFEDHTPVKEDIKVVRIKPLFIFLAVFVCALVIAAVIGVKRFADNIYVIRHNIQVRQMRRNRFKRVKQLKKNGRRKKDRLFR